MLNHGIPHDELSWNDAGNGGGSWTIHVHTELLGSVQVNIPVKNKNGRAYGGPASIAGYATNIAEDDPTSIDQCAAPIRYRISWRRC